MNLEKYNWQKPHQSNPTGTEKAYYPNKDKDNVINKKNIKVGNLNKIFTSTIIGIFNFKIFIMHLQKMITLEVKLILKF